MEKDCFSGTLEGFQIKLLSVQRHLTISYHWYYLTKKKSGDAGVLLHSKPLSGSDEAASLVGYADLSE